MAHVKKSFKVTMLLVGVAAVGLFFHTAFSRGWIQPPGILKSLVPVRAVVPDLREAKIDNPPPPVALPSEGIANVAATPITGEIWEWNAQANLIYANGGASTTAGSLMAKHGVNLRLVRQDNTDTMKTDLVDCAKEIHDGSPSCSKGANFVVIMGGGVPQFVSGPNAQLKKLGPEYILKVIGVTGQSFGEDSWMVPPEAKADKQQVRGLLVAGVIRDDDWNIALKWLGDNNMANNPDENTYDPNAVNWVHTDDYLLAAEAYNTNKCFDRKVIIGGKLTGETRRVCVNSVVTWTPGDVNIAHGRGGLVKLVSSKNYLMPAVVVGSGAFFQKNRDETNNLLAATFEAGDQLRAYDKALRDAGSISAKLYNDQDGSYWYKYYLGTTENGVQLGGSKVWGLAQAKILFGLEPGTTDTFRAIYDTFEAIDMQQYPKLFHDTPIPDVAQIEDRSYLTGAEAVMTSPEAEPEQPNYKAASASGNVISSKPVYINFDTGKATLTPEGIETMKQLRDSIAITQLSVAIDGYTDNTGSDAVNVPLSAARAEAVRAWLQQTAKGSFPDTRFAHVEGHGKAEPIADNSTEAGRAQNRRVVIALLGAS